jgi:hypothetical protein
VITVFKADKYTIALDFDGVIHRYISGWRGPRTIADGPVPGAIDQLLDYIERFDVVIFSSRFTAWGGKRAVRRWLVEQIAQELHRLNREQRLHLKPTTADYYAEYRAYHDVARALVRNELSFMREKPKACVIIDDRAWCFDGAFPSPAAIERFKPWNR